MSKQYIHAGIGCHAELKLQADAHWCSATFVNEPVASSDTG